MAYQTILVRQEEGIAVVTLNRPEKLNALNETVISELGTAFESIAGDPAVGAALLTGAGEKAFVAGADIAELSRLDAAAARANALRGQRLTLLMEEMDKPLIAAINGFALGGGLELAMACTLRVAVEGARLGQPEVKLGIICGYGGTQRLPRLVGRGRALELLVTGETVDAAEALRIGLVNRVVGREALLPESKALAAAILRAGPEAVRQTLRAVRGGLERPLGEALDLEADLFGALFGTPEMKEGTAAFLEKRPPRFRPRS
jgi:enoyl-CoA hydratase